MRVELIYTGILLLIIGFSAGSMIGEAGKRYAAGGTTDQDNPFDYISGNEIHLFSDKLVIDKPGLSYASVKDTKSMEPLLSSNSHVIEAKPEQNTLQKGDIISFTKQDKIITHAITEINTDAQGWYAITKGYNNEFNDKWKVRFDEIKGVVVGILN